MNDNLQEILNELDMPTIVIRHEKSLLKNKNEAIINFLVNSYSIFNSDAGVYVITSKDPAYEEPTPCINDVVKYRSETKDKAVGNVHPPNFSLKDTIHMQKRFEKVYKSSATLKLEGFADTPFDLIRGIENYNITFYFVTSADFQIIGETDSEMITKAPLVRKI